MKETVTKLKKKEDKKIKEVTAQTKRATEQEQVSQQVMTRNKKIPAKISRVLQQNIKTRNQLFTMTPTYSSFKSYEMYSVSNPIPTKTVNGVVLDITEEDVRRVFNYLKVAEYLKTKKSFKVWLSVGFLGWNMKDNKEREVDEEIYVGTTTKVIYTPADISSLIDDLVTNFNKTRESSYIKLFNLFKIDIHVAKVKALTASSYIELPDRIANKKAVISVTVPFKSVNKHSVIT